MTFPNGFREGITVEVTLCTSLKEDEAGHTGARGKDVPGREHSKCKGP